MANNPDKTRTFDLAGFKCIVGASEITGFEKGDSVTVTRDTNTFNDDADANGGVTRAKTNDKRGTITFNLMQAKPANETLSAIMLADELTNGGIVPIMLIDTNGTSVHSAAECWLLKPPDAAYGTEIKMRSWAFRAANVDSFFGKNN